MRLKVNLGWMARVTSFFHRGCRIGAVNVCLGRAPGSVSAPSIIFFPCRRTTLGCGLAGIVTFTAPQDAAAEIDSRYLGELLEQAAANGVDRCTQEGADVAACYLGGSGHMAGFLSAVQQLKRDRLFSRIVLQPETEERLAELARRAAEVIAREDAGLSDTMGKIGAREVDIMAGRIEVLRDIHWALKFELIENAAKVRLLLENSPQPENPQAIIRMKKINAVLNSLDRLEVRGRDSAGVSLMVVVKPEAFDAFQAYLREKGLTADFEKRTARPVLVNGGIECRPPAGDTGPQAVSVTFKVAAEIGKLGDNIRFIRRQIRRDPVVQGLLTFPLVSFTVSTHTRWASVGAISEPNCHPLDSRTEGEGDPSGIIHACLNGDIDNYLDLKRECEKEGRVIPDTISTDTKIIPIQIERYLRRGEPVEEAFRLAVNDFQGSHAISMHTDLAPGKLFLAQKGSGQAVFIGLAGDHYMPTSEVYGFVEETPRYLKMDGEHVVDGPNGRVQGQIFILDQQSAGGLEGIRAMYYDGTPVALGPDDVKTTEITSRDIDRQGFPHYFLKEISESPLSVARTIQNRWKEIPGGEGLRAVTLGQRVVPAALERALVDGQIRRIFFVGQGTAGVAAQACADILNYYLNDATLTIGALKSSELSGFKIGEDDRPDSLVDMLVVAISQSGTTTDTNRAVDMVRARGAHTLAIVNRRESDITFKVDGVMYTSSGRDVEMSVASTKAFYAQIVAGAMLGLYLAQIKGRRGQEFVTAEIKALLALPAHMRTILAMKERIGDSARRHAVRKTYWATVGSGPNKTSADEIRIKLSELCYKTISSDYVEDKKHIDLSSEPLIIVCAAGSASTVIGDIIKDTAIFQAHKATPIVIADENETRFDPYAADVFHVPTVGEHLAPIVNTLVGHLWGYYAALAINGGSEFLDGFRREVREAIDEYAGRGMDLYEVVLEKSFREKIAAFYREFRSRKAQHRLPVVMGFKTAADLTLLAKYLAGRLPVTDFEIDFGRKGTAANMIQTLFTCLGESINAMARPVDAIKHQAKTVTVGTSRISEGVRGILFDALAGYGLKISQLTNRNVIVLRNLQGIVADIRGAILYRIEKLSILGEPTEETAIGVVKKDGVLAAIPSRVESDPVLKGTKRIIVREGNVYIGKGRKDNRSIIVIPAISDSPEAPNLIEHLLLLNIAFQRDVALPVKIRALGGKYERIKNIVQENSVVWEDRYLDSVPIDELFGRSAEKVGEFIVGQHQPDAGR
jgi:glucosamine--fructose-6-phosphate aminotransferase (isomerizing)